jgi:hypothetical protein
MTPALIAAALHKSIDGTRVVNYAQWRSQVDHDRFLNTYGADLAPFAKSASFDPHLYKVVYLFERAR